MTPEIPPLRAGPVVAVIVVTYNRSAWLFRNLAALRAQTRRPDVIYLIDNASTDGTPQHLADAGEIPSPPPTEARAPWITRASGPAGALVYVRLAENLGGAGGFHAGVIQAAADGCDWLWLMDDDCLPEPPCLERLMSHAAGRPGDVFLANVFALEDGVTPIWEDKVWRARVPRAPGLVEAWSGTFNGFLLHRALAEKIGPPLAAMFIYGDDIEYGHRARRHGARVLVVGDAVLLHPGRLVDFRTRLRNCYSRFNLYYSIRNMRYLESLGIDILTPKRRLMSLVLTALHLLSLRLDLIRLTFQAWRDGAKGRLGRRDRW